MEYTDEAFAQCINELLFYVNRLKLKTNPKRMMKALLNRNSKEPGLTHEDLAGFNAQHTETSESFDLRLGEFEMNFGVRVVTFSEFEEFGGLYVGEVYLMVTDPEKYVTLLGRLVSSDLNDETKIGFIRNVEEGILYQLTSWVREGLKVDWVPIHHLLENAVVGTKNLVLRLQEIVEWHRKIDPHQLRENERRYLCASSIAHRDDYFLCFQLLNPWLLPEEGALNCSLKGLEDIREIVKYKYLASWVIALDYLEMAIIVYGKLAEWVITRVIKNLQAKMVLLKEKSLKPDVLLSPEDYEWLRYRVWLYEHTLESFATAKLVVPEERPSKKRETPLDKVADAYIAIEKLHLSSPEIDELIEKLKKLKEDNELPF